MIHDLVTATAASAWEESVLSSLRGTSFISSSESRRGRIIWLDAFVRGFGSVFVVEKGSVADPIQSGHEKWPTRERGPMRPTEEWEVFGDPSDVFLHGRFGSSIGVGTFPSTLNVSAPIPANACHI